MTRLLTSWLTRLKNADHVTVTAQILEEVKTANLNNDLYRQGVKALEKAVSQEDEAYKKTMKDWTVEELKQTDGQLEGYMKSIRKVLTGYAELPGDDEAGKRTAITLLQLFKDYNFQLSDSYAAEAAKVQNMYKDAQSQREAAEDMGVWTMMEKANAEAEKMSRLLDKRFSELAARNVGEMKRVRVATDRAVKQLYVLLSAMTALAPTDALTATARKLDAIEEYARHYYIAMKQQKD